MRAIRSLGGLLVRTTSTRAIRSPLATVLAAALTAAAVTPAVAQTTEPPPSEDTPRFSDLDSTIHAEAIGLIADAGITTGYPDGTFRPRDDVRRDQMATFLTAALFLEPVDPTFPDVPVDSPHYQAIGALDASGISRGFPDGTFRPRNVVTRGQMASFLATALELPAGEGTFSDVPTDYVHADAIAALAASGITSGFPDGTFRPNNAVKRDQMAAFLATGLGLPVEPEVETCPGSGQTAAATSASETSASETSASDEGTPTSSTTGAGSADLEEALRGDVTASAEAEERAAVAAAAERLGPAVPGTAFPLTSVIATGGGDLEVHTQDLAASRGARVSPTGDVTATTTIPAGRRTWATARIGSTVYAGQWNVGAAANLYRYTATANGNRTATAVATVPSGNEFWTLAADTSARLWAGTRAHNDSAVRQQTGLGNGLRDGRHVLHRVDQEGTVTAVLFCATDPVTTDAGVRADIKQVASVDDTLYVATGQLTGGARLYAFEPGTDTEIPPSRVRDLTPANVRGATGVFAMTASDRYVAFGTQAGSGDSARLVVIDRATEQVRVNVLLTGQSRVDAVSLDGDRVVAAAFGGELYQTTVPASGPIRTTATPHDEPVLDQFHRYVEFTSTGLRGVTQQGIVWTRTAATGDVEQTNLVDTGAPVSPGQPHSLHVGPSDVAVGATSAVTLRALDDIQTPRTVTLGGEAKAITSGDDGTTYVATYPNAVLWRIDAGGDSAEVVRPWTTAYRRPADADFDPRRDRVYVVARDDNTAQSEARPSTGPQADFQFRPSQLFRFEAAPSSGTQSGFPLTRPSGTSNVPVEASSLLTGTTPGGNEVYVGDTRGGVQRVSASDGARQWYRDAATDDRYRRVLDMQLVGDRLIVTTSGTLNNRTGGGTYAPRTVITELDPATGAVLARHQPLAPSASGPVDFAVSEALTSGDLTVMPGASIIRFFDRATQTYSSTSHATNDTFGPPRAEIDPVGCQLYTFEATPSQLARTPFTAGPCAPGGEEPPPP